VTDPRTPLGGLRIAIVRTIGNVDQDTRLHNVARSLARAGGDVVVLHLGRQREGRDEVDVDGVRWLALQTAGLYLGAAMQDKRDRANRRVAGRKGGRRQTVARRRRHLHLAESAVRLADPSTTMLTRLGLRAGVLRMEAGREFDLLQERLSRKLFRTTESWRDRITIGTSWRRQAPDFYAFEELFGPVLDELEPDVVHAHDLPALGVASRHRRRRALGGNPPRVVFDAIEDWAGLPYYSYITPRYLAAMQKYETEYIGDCDAVITVGQTLSDALVARHPSLPAPLVVMSCPRAGDREKAKTDLRTALGIGADVPLMLYSGGINAARGLDIALEALPLLPGWYFGVVALPYPHRMEPEMRAKAEALGVGDRVLFAPPVPGKQIVDYLSGADVGIIPASNEFANLRAGMPNKLFEYLNAGLSVVSSDLPELSRFLERFDVGTSFAYPSTKGFADAVLEAYRRHPHGIDAVRRVALRDVITWESQEPTLLRAFSGSREESE
jgi:glycosyltransferase involved in cell wall biosynthesis